MGSFCLTGDIFARLHNTGVTRFIGISSAAGFITSDEDILLIFPWVSLRLHGINLTRFFFFLFGLSFVTI